MREHLEQGEDPLVVECLDHTGRLRPAVLRAAGLEAGQSPGRLSVRYLRDGTDAPAGHRKLAGGIVTGGFTDWHVHLHLINPGQLEDSPITRVHDLGGDPADLAKSAGFARGAELSKGAEHLPLEVLHAGAFLTAPGGYPSDRSWAPPGSFREISGSAEAAAAVSEMAAAGASAIKVASNSEAGPVFSDELLSAIVGYAREAGLQVVAHAEGPGEAMRVARHGATRLAHSPFSERLTDDELAELAARTSWCSTLDIHGWGEGGREHQIAVANVAGFVRHGGHLLYGTDMGNGPTITGLNARELASLAEAGLGPERQLAALTPRDPRGTAGAHGDLIWVPRDDRGQLDVAAARRL